MNVGKDIYYYTGVVTKKKENGFVLTVPAFDISMYSEESLEILIDRIEKSIGDEMYRMDKESIKFPEPDGFNFDDKHIVTSNPNQRLVLIKIYMKSVRRRNKESFVQRAVSLPTWLDELADENKINKSKLFQRAIKQELGIE